MQVVEGLPQLRPSVEAGFHSILKTYVLHTHSVFANMAACTIGGREVAEEAFRYAPYTWGWVDYQDPGAKLAFAIREELDRVERATGRVPAVIIMQNHGIIVHDDDAVSALAIHADANVRLAAHYGLAENAFGIDLAPTQRIQIIGFDDASLFIDGVFHAVNALERRIFLLHDSADDVVGGDGIVVGDGEAVHPIGHHALHQLGAGNGRIGFNGVIV